MPAPPGYETYKVPSDAVAIDGSPPFAPTLPCLNTSLVAAFPIVAVAPSARTTKLRASVLFMVFCLRDSQGTFLPPTLASRRPYRAYSVHERVSAYRRGLQETA